MGSYQFSFFSFNGQVPKNQVPPFTLQPGHNGSCFPSERSMTHFSSAVLLAFAIDVPLTSQEMAAAVVVVVVVVVAVLVVVVVVLMLV